MNATKRHISNLTTALALAALAACSDDVMDPIDDGGAPAASRVAGGPPPPAGLADIQFRGQTPGLWPFTGGPRWHGVRSHEPGVRG